MGALLLASKSFSYKHKTAPIFGGGHVILVLATFGFFATVFFVVVLMIVDSLSLLGLIVWDKLYS
jgi:nitrogen fixation protein FixH